MSSAQLTVTSGPDRGRTFDLAEELVHIGRGAENQVVLRDPTLEDHQASIVCRQGRYAIYTPIAETVDVDGDPLPPDQWVWLPDEAKIRIGERTSVVFHLPNGAAEPDPATPRPLPKVQAGTVDPFADDDDEPVPDAPAERTPAPENRGKRGAKPKRRRRKRGEAGDKPQDKRQVARFVTDQSGDTVVTLGEDGQLPELKLREGATARERRTEKPAQEGTSPLLYVALAFSMLSSVALLLLDFTPGQSGQRERAIARQSLEQEGFLDSGDRRPEPYQVHLRNAVLARQRRDFSAELREYRGVLTLLKAEDVDPYLGLTGSPDRDRRLYELIAILLNR